MEVYLSMIQHVTFIMKDEVTGVQKMDGMRFLGGRGEHLREHRKEAEARWIYRPALPVNFSAMPYFKDGDDLLVVIYIIDGPVIADL
jgi:hypothetical protein